MRRLAVMMMAVIGVAAVAARPATACFGGCFDIFLSFPAITCAGDGFTRTGGGIFNTTSGSKWIMCPVPADSKAGFGKFASALQINVSAGTSCFAVAGDAAANIWSIPPSSLKSFSGFVELDWGWNDLSGSGGRNLSIQCFVPTGGRATQYFVETIWEGVPVIGTGGRYRRPAVVACTIAVAAIAGVAGVSRLRAAGRPDAPPGMAAAAASDDDLAAISAEVRELRNDVRTLRRRAAQAQPGVPIPSPTCDVGTRASHEQDPPSLAADHERAVTQSKRLDDRLVAEVRDSAWAPAFEQTLRKATESALTDPGAESIARADCRSTLCRLEVRHPDTSHGDSFQTRFRLAMPDVVYRVSQAQNDDGSYSSVFHIIRKGEPIPSG